MQKKRMVVYFVIIFIIFLIAVFIYYFREKIGKILMPFFMALVIAYLLRPLVKRLERRKISTTVSIFLIYIAFSILFTGVVIFVIPEVVNNIKELINTLPEITNRYQSIADRIFTSIRSSNWPPDFKNAMFREIEEGTMAVQNAIVAALKKSLMGLLETFTMLFDLVLALIIAYYFIKDAEFFKNLVLSLTPRKWRNGIINSGRDINLILSRFIQGQLLTALIVGIMEMIGLLIVGVKYPVVLGLIGGLANIIPYFGPIIGAIPAVSLAIIDSPLKAAWAVIVFIIVQQIDNAFISAKIIEGRLGLHPVTTILAVLIGGEFFGITGMLVSVPVLAIVKSIAKRAVEAIV